MSASFEDGFFADLIAEIAPRSDDVVVILKSYFDESYDKSLLCVAGYIFTSRNARGLDTEWRKMLFRYKRLPYFRMSACNSHRPPFDRLTEQQCIDVATEAINLIKKYAALGFAITVDQAAFNKVVTRKGVVSTPYELCAWLCLVAAKAEADKSLAPGPMAFFEAGFEHQNLANRMMNNIFKSPELRESYRYKAHAFVHKEEIRPIQAADLLAWQWYKSATRLAKGILKARGDLLALIEGTPHWTFHANANRLQDLVDRINLLAGSPMGNEIAGIALTNPSSPLFPKRRGGAGSSKAYQQLKKEHRERS